MIRLIIDLNTQRFVRSIADNASPTNLSFKRGDSVDFEIQFIRNGVGQELPGGTQMRLGIKLTASLSSSYLVGAASLAKNGQGASTLYVCSPNTNTVELNAAIGIETTSEKTFISAGIEVEWITPDGKVRSTDIAPIQIFNDLNRGNEGVPVNALPHYPQPDELELVARKGAVGGYAGLDANGKIPQAQLPEYVILNPDTRKRYRVTVTGNPPILGIEEITPATIP